MITPEKQFYIFGMGHREKFLYKDGVLFNVKTNEKVFSWDVLREKFLYDRYMVVLWTVDERVFLIEENEHGLYVSEITNEKRENSVCLASSEINLPDFEECKYSAQLRILHQEVLTSFIGNEPVPNIYVYDKAWYRDGAMMALVLEKTGNIDLLRDWALSLTELYDMNNKGNKEPDNLGQLAFVLSFFVDKNHPMIGKIIREAKAIMNDGLLTGLTDYNHHEIYATLWLKYGFERLGIDTSFIKIPEKFDSYARMFWMNKKEVERTTPYENKYDEWYPYLWWAVKHFENEPIDEKYFEIKYPMSWEIDASQAKYPDIFEHGLQYAGVQSLSASSVDLRVLARVSEANIYKGRRLLNREMKIAFDEANNVFNPSISPKEISLKFSSTFGSKPNSSPIISAVSFALIR